MRINTCTMESTTRRQPGVCVSQISGHDFKSGKMIDGVMLSVFRAYERPKDGKTGFINVKYKHCDGNGRVFKSRQECDRFCLERGYTREWYPSPDLKARCRQAAQAKGTSIQ